MGTRIPIRRDDRSPDGTFAPAFVRSDATREVAPACDGRSGVRTCYFFKVWALGFSSTGSHSSRIAQGSHIAAGRHYQRQQQPAVLSLGPSQGPQTKLPDTAPSHDSPHSSVCSHQVIDQYVFFHRQSLHRVRRPFQVVHGQSPLMVRHHRGCLWPPACPTLTGRRWRRRRGEPCSLRWARPSRSSGTRPGRC
jgi:hypothetical protein